MKNAVPYQFLLTMLVTPENIFCQSLIAHGSDADHKFQSWMISERIGADMGLDFRTRPRMLECIEGATHVQSDCFGKR